ncbi:chaperone protein DnaJ [Pleomorphomonas sp. SM30]|uniref:DnaJ-like protein n=2 Tax=Oharaeibacter diazotrophicus TaxID=1920512 RepID=A0A4R6RD46_9HYPH|nr:J domain-containing protein [Oharaeibacter diazotrophicus]TDP84004.1 DnaJ-like protein [Oharaeibacter diazotrophicus]BBE73043.1 chaperone protein DnaJ [Pleomorphomonas sp. SM30]GLS74831.1 molecular chaperone DnaJ [Oharaeibacter diazotrophicus]
MAMNSKLFDRIRIRPDAETTARERFPTCEWAGCEAAGTHRAPKGRGREGQYHRYCLDHVREYNKSYNYFAGMADEAVAAFQKDALTGHRPTWTIGVDRRGADPRRGFDGPDPSTTVNDPFGIFHGARPAGSHGAAAEPRRKVSAPTQQAFDTMDLDPAASREDIKARFKALVKRHHPDANGGDRASEERLRQIIQAYNYLKTAGFC